MPRPTCGTNMLNGIAINRKEVHLRIQPTFVWKISSTKKYTINYSKRESSIPIINEYICELQACLAQYLTVSLDKHMKLKDTHSNNEKRGAIETLFNDLNDFLNESIDNAFEITHQHIDKYFSGRSKFHPRITIKAPFEEQLIVDLYRKDRSPFNQFGVTENTAFKYIKDTGKYFICNDIPKAVKEEKYSDTSRDVFPTKPNELDVKGLFYVWIYDFAIAADDADPQTNLKSKENWEEDLKESIGGILAGKNGGKKSFDELFVPLDVLNRGVN